MIGPDFQLNAPPPKVAVEAPYSMDGAPLLLGPEDWTEQEIPDDPRTNTSDIAVKPERGIERRSIAVTGEGQGAKPQQDNKAGWGLSSKWGQNDVPVYAPSASSELYSDQEASDAALQANAAAATQKVMVTPPPLPLQTTGGANKELDDGEKEETFMGTPVTDSKGGISPPAPPASKDPKVAVQEAFKQGLEGTPATTGTPGNMGTVGISEDLRNRLAGAAEGFDEVGTSIDRLPVVGIRKARRGILVV